MSFNCKSVVLYPNVEKDIQSVFFRCVSFRNGPFSQSSQNKMPKGSFSYFSSILMSDRCFYDDSIIGTFANLKKVFGPLSVRINGC